MENLPKISDAEFEIMKIIWDKNPISTNEIVETVKKTSSQNVRTIQTLISRLEKKGAISHKKEGKLYVYLPLIDKNEYISKKSTSFLDKFYNGAINRMVMNFIENDMLTDDDIATLKNILDKG